MPSSPATHGLVRSLGRRLLPADLRLIVRALLQLPPRVASFYIRAHLSARRQNDGFSLIAPTRPKDLRRILALARGRRHVVELGTGTAWTAAALAIDDPDRIVSTFDPVEHSCRAHYLQLAGPDAQARVRVYDSSAEQGPPDGTPPVELLFIDIGGHSRTGTVAAFAAWRDALAPDAVVTFHDYSPAFPGVPMAVAQLGLHGRLTGESLFVCRFPQVTRTSSGQNPGRD